jgi:beta-galactosidase/beta-glucuronidase
VTSGIWRGIELRAWGEGRIENVQIITENLSKNQAGLITKIELDVQKTGKYSVNISLDSILNYSGTWNLEFGIKSLEIPIFIENPELWWPNGLGDQKLYTITVEILKNNEVIDRQETTIGLRTARLVQDPDPDGQGRSFYFEVNGRPVFAKGANYIPNDIFLNRVSPEKYEFIVKSAADANMNMLRVWGGGIYEEDLFYDLCDQYGIMVWQDFMFACAMYPGDDAFLENVRLEAIDNVNACAIILRLCSGAGITRSRRRGAHMTKNAAGDGSKGIRLVSGIRYGKPMTPSSITSFQQLFSRKTRGGLTGILLLLPAWDSLLHTIQGRAICTTGAFGTASIH